MWLEDENGHEIDLAPGDLDAEMRRLVPFRTAGGFDGSKINLTYNLSPMLWDAGFPGWKEIVDKPAKDIGPIARSTLDKLRADPTRARTFTPENGWGSYEQAVEAMALLAAACDQHPTATVRGWL